LTKNKLQCLLCSRSIEWLYPLAEDIDLLREAGEVGISFGYGSAHDNDIAKAFICDECFSSSAVRERLYFYALYDSRPLRSLLVSDEQTEWGLTL